MKIPRAAIYTQYTKARHSTEAMVAGFPADQLACAEGRLSPHHDLHLFGGLQFGCDRLMRETLKIRAQFVFWDRAYFGGGTATDRLRVTFNNYQKVAVDAPARSLERFEAMGGKLKPWRVDGSRVMVVPPSEAIQGLFAGHDWEPRTLSALRKCCDRPVFVSRKGDPIPLAERLKDCWCVVTWSSNVAVEAICAGVPAYTGPMSAADRVSNGLHDIYNGVGVENPLLPDRESWAASLAWGQFTLDEIKSGMAREIVLRGWQ